MSNGIAGRLRSFCRLAAAIAVLSVSSAAEAQQITTGIRGAFFVPRDLQGRRKGEEWHTVGSDNLVTIKGKSYRYRQEGMRHYVISTSKAAGRQEVRAIYEKGTTYIRPIKPVRQKNHAIFITNVTGACLRGMTVPIRRYIDKAGKLQFEIILQDVTYVRAKGMHANIPLAYDGRRDRIVFWAKQVKMAVGGRKYANTVAVYIDPYGSFYNEKNCYNPRLGAGALFAEVSPAKVDSMGSTQGGARLLDPKYFCLTKDEKGNVVPRYLSRTDRPQSSGKSATNNEAAGLAISGLCFFALGGVVVLGLLVAAVMLMIKRKPTA